MFSFLKSNSIRVCVTALGCVLARDVVRDGISLAGKLSPNQQPTFFLPILKMPGFSVILCVCGGGGGGGGGGYVFLRLLLRHMEVASLRVQSEL